MQRDRRRFSKSPPPSGPTEVRQRPSATAPSLGSEAREQLRDTLLEGVATLGLALPDRAMDQLLDYLALLLRWNQVYNLTAVRDPVGMTTQHLLDSLTSVPALQRHAAGRTLRILDVGSGGGLPGVVWAATCPEHRITCVDAVAKKTTFVRQVAAELGLGNLSAEHARVETLRLPPFPLITARAFASLSDIVRLTDGLLAPDGVWLAMKGQHPHDEIAALPDSIEVFHVEPLQVPGMDAERCIVWMRRRTDTRSDASSLAP